MTKTTYTIKPLVCCSKKANLFSCPCCGSAPVVCIGPMWSGGYEKLGPMRSVECPHGCFKTRKYWFGKEVSAWNARVSQIANQQYKSERGKRIKQALEVCDG